MFGLRFFKKNKHVSKPIIYTSSSPIGVHNRKATRYQVLASIGRLRPCHYRMISDDLDIIEGSVTPRIKELERDDLVKVVGKRKGYAGVLCNYYDLTPEGLRLYRNLYK